MANANDGSGTMIVALILAAMATITYVIFLIAAFITFVMTIFCLFAWNRPIGSGKTLIQPDEARSFIKRGLAGAVIMPLFFVFLEVFLGITVNWDYFFHFMAAGYIGGSLVIQVMIAQDAAAASAPVEPAYRRTIDVQPEKSLPAPKPPFQFASWDDEETRE